jgi:hypothetical protein
MVALSSLAFWRSADPADAESDGLDAKDAAAAAAAKEAAAVEELAARLAETEVEALLRRGGEAGLAPAVVMFMTSNVLHYSYGAWLLDHETRLRDLWKSPSIIATVAGTLGLGRLLPFDKGQAIMGAQDAVGDPTKAKIDLGVTPRPGGRSPWTFPSQSLTWTCSIRPASLATSAGLVWTRSRWEMSQLAMTVSGRPTSSRKASIVSIELTRESLKGSSSMAIRRPRSAA